MQQRVGLKRDGAGRGSELPRAAWPAGPAHGRPTFFPTRELKAAWPG